MSIGTPAERARAKATAAVADYDATMRERARCAELVRAVAAEWRQAGGLVSNAPAALDALAELIMSGVRR